MGALHKPMADRSSPTNDARSPESMDMYMIFGLLSAAAILVLLRGGLRRLWHDRRKTLYLALWLGIILAFVLLYRVVGPLQ